MKFETTSPSKQTIKEIRDTLKKSGKTMTPDQMLALQKKLEAAARTAFSYKSSAVATTNTVITSNNRDLKEQDKKVKSLSIAMKAINEAAKKHEITREERKDAEKKIKTSVIHSAIEEGHLKRERSAQGKLQSTCIRNYNTDVRSLTKLHKEATKRLGKKQVVEKKKNGEVILSSKEKTSIVKKVQNLFK